MALLSGVKEKIDRWRSTDPYNYECTVCDRSFQGDREACPNCGADVERSAGRFESAGVDPNP